MLERIKSRQKSIVRKADEWSETKVARKANVGAKQKSSERQMWVENKCESQTKVGRRDCPKSQTFLSENRESDSGLVGVRSISVSQGLFGRPGVEAKTKVVRKKTNEADPKGQPHSVYVIRAK